MKTLLRCCRGPLARRVVPALLLGMLCSPAGVPVAADPVAVGLVGVDGKPLPVVVAPGSGEIVRAAAGELAAYLGRITGVSFAVLEGDGSAGIAVGVHGDFPELETGVLFDPADPFRREEYLLRTHERGAWLLGATERAAVHAAWDFLHRLGYRHFFLNDNWEVIPADPAPRPALDVLERPDYVARRAPGRGAWTSREHWDRWHERNRVATAFTLNTGHAYGGIISANRAAFEAHPEFYALVDGERRDRGGNSKFCIGNPDLRRLVVAHAVRVIGADPGRDSISMDPSDGGNWCECADCEALGSVSDRVVTLANEVAAAINDLGLGDKYVGIYAYNQHSPPPAIRVHPKVVVSIATAFIRGGYTVEELVEGWASAGAMLGVREYGAVFVWDHDMPRRSRSSNIAYLARTIPWFHEQGARFMTSDGGDSWGACGLGFWLSARLVWDVSAAGRLDEYVEDFLEKSFGPAREPMGDFFRLLNLDRAPRTPADVTGRLYRHLAAARALTDDPAVHARLDDLVLYTRYVELYHDYRGASGAARQDRFEQLWRHVYRMRDRMMVKTVAICHRERYRDRSVNLPEGVSWTTPEAEHPWKDSTPFAAAELAALVTAGIENNPIQEIDFTPVEYGEALAPAAALGLAEVVPGNFSLRGRGTRRFLTWLEAPGAIDLRVTGGLMTQYRDRGNVRLELFAADEASLEAVARDESVPPDGNEYPVTLRSPYAGLHTLQVSDGGDRTDIVLPEGLPLTILSSLENPPGGTLDGRWTLYFYVPRGTAVVGGFARDRSGTLLDGEGSQVFAFAAMDDVGYFSVPVPAGQDGRLWRIENSSGHKLLMTVPPYLARSEKELLLPVEVIAADRQ